MGSAKYPQENDYDDFLTKHGGAANAFTDLVGELCTAADSAAAYAVPTHARTNPACVLTCPQELTNYHFEVSPPHLAGALDRFAQFFTAPLCNEGSMEREVRQGCAWVRLGAHVHVHGS